MIHDADNPRKHVMTTTLDRRTALVTGAGRGIGRAIAIGLGRRGVRVGLLARTQRDLDEVAAEIRDDGGTAIALAADIGDAGQTRSALDRLAGELGPVELLVNNAAVVWPLGPTHDVDPDAVAAAMTINVVAPMTITRRVLPGMLSAGWGRIVNVSAAIAGHPGMLAGLNTYAASKGGLEAHTLNLAAELDGTGVTVNVYRPGTVDTSVHAYIRARPREQIGASLHDVFTGMLSSGALITPQTTAESLLARLTGPQSGQIWDVSDPIPDQEN
jgi:NAD(P)-dependent dehydrogenase (short-subunit alcohol dehydrogenase family)